MRVPDVAALPLARGEEDDELGLPRIKAGAPAQIIGRVDGFQTELRAAEIDFEWWAVEVAVALALLQKVGEILLLRREFGGRSRGITNALRGLYGTRPHAAKPTKVRAHL